MQPSGLGSALVEVEGVRVGALVVVNPVGDVFTPEGRALTGGNPVPGPPASAITAHTNTTLVAVATEARLDRVDLIRLCIRSHDAVAVCVRPAHTRYDGDAVFAISCGAIELDPDALGEAAFVATARAIGAAVRAARSGVPARREM